MPRSRTIPCFVLAACAAAASCGPPRVDMREGARNFEPADYQRVFETWTRDLSIIPVDGIENVLTVRVTYLGYEFRWGYVVKVAQDLRMSPAERQDLQDREFTALARGHEFFVSSMSAFKGVDNLAPDDGPWRVRLVDDRGRAVAPVSVEEVKHPETSAFQYFAFDLVHRTPYRIVFPRAFPDGEPVIGPATRFFTLAFSSPLGQGEVRWDSAAPASPAPTR
ncbi:MAG: hypothetical protein PHU25_04300 [Deltaproteobacteria bacterium]|nr:hypothetical protein [Deltaproteobacteria bacterium]